MIINWRIYLMHRLLREQKIHEIWNLSLKTLGNIGVKCENKKTIDLLLQKTKAKYKNKRILFDIDEINEYFCRKKQRMAGFATEDNEEFKLTSQWNACHLCDPITNKIRGASYDECVQMARLAESLGAIGSPIPLTPIEVSPANYTILSEKISLFHTKNIGGNLPATDNEEIKYLVEMNKIAQRKYRIGLGANISPLTLDSCALDIYYNWFESPDVEIILFTNMPMAGATAPLTCPANLVQTIAEALSYDFVFNNISDGRHQKFYVTLYPFNMKDLNISFGSPEWCIFYQYLVELCDNIAWKGAISGSFRTNGKTVDAQSLIERTASFIWQAMLGIRSFSGVGQLCVDEVFSPVQAVLDKELINYGKRLFEFDGYWNEETNIIGVIKEGIREGNFFVLDSTASNYKKNVYPNSIFSSNNLSAWIGSGSKTINELAWDEAQKIISNHNFELEDSKKKDIEKVYNKAIEYISCRKH